MRIDRLIAIHESFYQLTKKAYVETLGGDLTNPATRAHYDMVNEVIVLKNRLTVELLLAGVPDDQLSPMMNRK